MSLNDAIGAAPVMLESSLHTHLRETDEATSPTRAILRVIGIILAVAGGLWAVHRLERVVLVLMVRLRSLARLGPRHRCGRDSHTRFRVVPLIR